MDVDSRVKSRLKTGQNLVDDLSDYSKANSNVKSRVAYRA